MHIYTNKGTRLTISPEDAELFEGRKVVESRRGLQIYNPEIGRVDSVGRMLLKLRPGDPRHARPLDGDWMDLRRSNLVALSPEKSMSLRDRSKTAAASRERLYETPMPRPKGKAATSKFRGVTKTCANGNKDQVIYQSRFTHGGKTITLGSTFKSEEEAARAYDAARIAHGLNPVNFPEE